jgi:hypothetical protein
MKSQNLITNPWNTRGNVVPPEAPEERHKNGPSPAEIRRRASEIHIEHGGIHGCDLNDWRRRNASSSRSTRTKCMNIAKDAKTK